MITSLSIRSVRLLRMKKAIFVDIFPVDSTTGTAAASTGSAAASVKVASKPSRTSGWGVTHFAPLSMKCA